MARVDAKRPENMILEDLEYRSVSLEPLPFKKQANHVEAEKSHALPTASEMWSVFVDGTALHGIRYVFLKRPFWARIAWLIILLAFTGYFLYTAYKSLSNYFSYPINTVITQEYVSELEFPAVTICPLNLISKKKMFALDGDANFVKYGLKDPVCDATASVRAGKPCGAAIVCCCLSFILFQGSLLVPNCTDQYYQDLVASQSTSGTYFNATKFYQQYSQSVEEMLVPGVCIFGGNLNESCTAEDFATTVTDFGVCRTFNAGLDGQDSIKKSTMSGPGGGLSILLDTQIDDHFLGRLSEGFSVVIHRQGDFFSSWDGINVAPGTLATIVLHQQRIKNLEAPHKTKCKDKQLKSFRSYTTSGCHYECINDFVVENCKCRAAGFTGVPTVRTCGVFDEPCIENPMTLQNLAKDCDCPVPCNEIRYTTDVHYSKFPDAGTAAILQQLGYNRSLDYLSKNSVFLQINYKSLNYELHEQMAAFGSEALFGEIGGNLGLFLGCSIMTVFEFADFLVALIYVRRLHKEFPT